MDSAPPISVPPPKIQAGLEQGLAPFPHTAHLLPCPQSLHSPPQGSPSRQKHRWVPVPCVYLYPQKVWSSWESSVLSIVSLMLVEVNGQVRFYGHAVYFLQGVLTI